MAQSTKIMLVEDDNNLGEIYMARMAAEGYSVVVAHDGEEALALAAKEKPDLIISDVMMPKISGFEMLDILRNTPGLRDTKVIMLTALGQAEDKTRAQSLGADRYLVKSQVTLEDIVENARALLSGDSATASQVTAETAAAQPAAAVPATDPLTAAPQTIAPTAPAADPVPLAVQPAAAPEPVAMPVADPPSPIAVTPDPAAVNSGNLAQPLNSSAAGEVEEPKTEPIADIVAASEPPQPAPKPLNLNPTPAAPVVPATAPAPQAAEAPSAPALPPAEATVASASDTNDKVLTGAVDELLANAPKATAPAPAAAPAAPTAKILDDGGNDLDTGSTESQRVSGKKIIAPINDISKKPDLNALLANEEAKAAGADAMAGSPGITTSMNGVQTTVVMPSGASIGGVSAPPAVNPPANLTEPQAPGQNNPNVTNPASAQAPGANFDPSSVAL